MKIRFLEKEEISELLTLGESFFNTTLYAKAGAEYDKDTMGAMLEVMVENNLVIVASDESKIVGFLLLLIAPVPFANFLSGTELAFYVDPEYQSKGIGHNLIVTAEEVLKKKGAHIYSMAALSNSDHDSVVQMYERMGFVHTETTYSKVI